MTLASNQAYRAALVEALNLDIGHMPVARLGQPLGVRVAQKR